MFFPSGDPHQFEQKFNYRRPMYPILKYMWSKDSYRESIKVREHLFNFSYILKITSNSLHIRTSLLLSKYYIKFVLLVSAFGRLCIGKLGGHESSSFSQVP